MTDQVDVADPTDEEIRLTKFAEGALDGLIEHLGRDGVPMACIVTAIDTRLVSLISEVKGFAAAAEHFRALAETLEGIEGPKN